jgi:hypothetical protein
VWDMGLGLVDRATVGPLCFALLACSGPSPESHHAAPGAGAGTGGTTLAEAGATAAGGSTTAAGGSTPLEGGGRSATPSAGAEGCSVPAPEGNLKLEGDLLISDAASLDAAQAYTEVTGTVRVATSFVGGVDLPNLTAVGGDLAAESEIISSPSPSIVESGVTRLRAANLRTIGGSLFVYLNFKLVELDLRSLSSAGYVFIDRNTILQMVRLDAYPTDLSFDAPLPDCLVPAFPNVLVTSPITASPPALVRPNAVTSSRIASEA